MSLTLIVWCAEALWDWDVPPGIGDCRSARLMTDCAGGRVGGVAGMRGWCGRRGSPGVHEGDAEKPNSWAPAVGACWPCEHCCVGSAVL